MAILNVIGFRLHYTLWLAIVYSANIAIQHFERLAFVNEWLREQGFTLVVKGAGGVGVGGGGGGGYFWC